MQRPARAGVPGPGEMTIARRLLGEQRLGIEGVVADDAQPLAGEALDLLHQVVGEGVVVVDDGDHEVPRWELRVATEERCQRHHRQVNEEGDADRRAKETSERSRASARSPGRGSS